MSGREFLLWISVAFLALGVIRLNNESNATREKISELRAVVNWSKGRIESQSAILRDHDSRFREADRLLIEQGLEPLADRMQ